MKPLTEEIKAKLAKRIREIEFSTRTHNALFREGIVFVRDLVQQSESQLLGIYGLGKKSVREVKAYLAPELKLGMRLTEWSGETALEFAKTAHSDDAVAQQEASIERKQLPVLSLPSQIKVRLATRIKSVGFSARTQNALSNEGLVYIGDVVLCSETMLLRAQGFGRKSLLEVKQFLAPDLHVGMSFDGWTRELAVTLEKQCRAEILANGKASFRQAITKDGPVRSLNEELQRLARAFSRDNHQADVVKTLYGWDGSEAKTLEETGQIFGVTRERVRQIESTFIKRIRQVQLDLEWLARAFREIAEAVPATQSQIETALIVAGILESPLRFSAINAAIELVFRKQAFIHVLTNGANLVVNADQGDLPNEFFASLDAAFLNLGVVPLAILPTR